ncbi:hypothetical protein BT93_H1051 [Corymbia citriodora subsp. variegata]|nr:hypothetical protein BT93_H1051 [Corymbia citriodora subsp. variegata]
MAVTEGAKPRGGPDFFSALPEGCIASVVSFTSPPDACRLATLSGNFKWACDSDVVWASFLPPDWRQMVSSRRVSSLKELYFSLCNDPVLSADGKMSFLDRYSGKKCIMLSARALSIALGDTSTYWSWNPIPSSRFAEVAELIRAWWLEMRDTISSCMLSPGTLYAAYLVFKSKPTSYKFDFRPVKVAAGFVGDEAGKCERLVYLFSENNTRGRQSRRDGWLEIELGEFLTKDGEDREIEMSVSETTLDHHKKGGLVVGGIEIRPKDGKEQCLCTGRV